MAKSAKVEKLPKRHKSLRLDPRILEYFEKESEKTGISTNALINAALLKLVRGK